MWGLMQDVRAPVLADLPCQCWLSCPLLLFLVTDPPNCHRHQSHLGSDRSFVLAFSNGSL
eukprot:6059633-Amphidinium_carterae.1